MTTLSPSTLERPFWPAIFNGLKCRCPKCGQGKLFRGYTKVVETCAACGETMAHARADDFPPYITITIVGHMIVMAMMHFEMTTPLHPMVYMATMLPAAILMSLAILPSVKGAIVAFQWTSRMHGFGGVAS